MTRLLRLLLLFSIITPTQALANEQVKQALQNYAWEKRQLIVFSPSANAPEYLQFNRIVKEFAADFEERRLHTWRVLPKQAITLDYQPQSAVNAQAFYEHFKIKPTEFMVLLVGYDQGVKLKQNPFDVDSLFGEIDQMPMRQDEMEEQASMQKAASQHSGMIDNVSRDDAKSTLGGQWQMVSDQVMGGVSSGKMLVSQKAGRQCLQLQGKVSTENNGGFLQLALDLNRGKAFDASAFAGIEIDVLGNNEPYNLHLRTKGLWFPWQAYRASFTATPRWQTIKIPFTEFKGYKTTKRLNLKKLKRIGLVAIGKDYQADVCMGGVRFY